MGLDRGNSIYKPVVRHRPACLPDNMPRLFP